MRGAPCPAAAPPQRVLPVTPLDGAPAVALLTLLAAQRNGLQELQAILHEERRVLCGRQPQALHRLARRKRQVCEELRQLEHKRLEWVRTWLPQLPAPVTLTQVAEHLDASRARRVHELGGVLSALAAESNAANVRNRDLLAFGRQLVQDTLERLAALSVHGDGYRPDGRPRGTAASGGRLVSARM